MNEKPMSVKDNQTRRPSPLTARTESEKCDGKDEEDDHGEERQPWEVQCIPCLRGDVDGRHDSGPKGSSREHKRLILETPHLIMSTLPLYPAIIEVFKYSRYLTDWCE